MKTCHAGHYPILFEADRCPACEAIERLDKVNLKLQVEIENLKSVGFRLRYFSGK